MLPICRIIARSVECLKMNEDHARKPLLPLAYHENVVAHLRSEERHAWEWSSSGALTQEVGEIRDTMLRDTYRLEQASTCRARFISCFSAPFWKSSSKLNCSR